MTAVKPASWHPSKASEDRMNLDYNQEVLHCPDGEDAEARSAADLRRVLGQFSAREASEVFRARGMLSRAVLEALAALPETRQFRGGDALARIVKAAIAEGYDAAARNDADEMKLVAAALQALVA